MAIGLLNVTVKRPGRVKRYIGTASIKENGHFEGVMPAHVLVSDLIQAAREGKVEIVMMVEE